MKTATVLAPTQTNCQICHRPICENCRCAAAVKRYLQILLAAEQRAVSSRQSTSESVGFRGTACIDKLTFVLPQALTPQGIFRRQQCGKLAVREVRLRDRKSYLQVGPKERALYFQGHFGSTELWKVVSRPSAYPSYASYLEDVGKVLDTNLMSKVSFRRLDIAVDYAVDLESFLMSLDISRKRAKYEFIDMGSNRTGVRVGSGVEKFVIYDKARRNGQADPLTRLEVQLSGSKLPCQDFEGLFALQEFSPFKSVSLHDVNLPDADILLTPSLRKRLSEFKILLRREGYLAARLKLGKHGNFERDYGKYLTKRPWSETPDEAVRHHFRLFFSKHKTHGTIP